MSFIEIQSLSKTYKDGTQAIENLSLTINQGELVVLVGPSGCGKTSALNIIAGLSEPTSGTIHLKGSDITQMPPPAQVYLRSLSIHSTGAFLCPS